MSAAGSGGAGKPAAEMRKTMQKQGKDEKKRTGVVHRSVLPPFRFNHDPSDQRRISSETTPVFRYTGGMREHSSKGV